MSFFFRQFRDKETSTYTYIFGDLKNKKAAIVDSVKGHAKMYSDELIQVGLKLEYLFETHVHADHITANSDLLKIFPDAKVCIHEKAEINCERVLLKDGMSFFIGDIKIEVLYTPGHTIESCTFMVNNDRVLTGDTMLINSCGRTDFQAGNTKSMYDSLQRLSKLQPDVLVYPGHDYNGRWVSSFREQLENNKLLKMSYGEFEKELLSWNLPPPKNIHIAVPGNQNCGGDD